MMKFQEFEAKELGKHNDLWVAGTNTDYMLCNFNFMFHPNSYE